MGCSHVWVCDDLKQYIDPYPLDEPHLFAMCEGGPWRGHAVRMLCDYGGTNDEYYLRTCRTGAAAGAGDEPDLWGGGAGDVYQNVTAEAKALARERFARGWPRPLTG